MRPWGLLITGILLSSASALADAGLFSGMKISVFTLRDQRIATVTGTLNRRDGTALIAGTPLEVDPAGRFNLRIALVGGQTQLPVRIITDYGLVLDEPALTLPVEPPKSPTPIPPGAPPRHAGGIAGSLGFSVLSYEDGTHDVIEKMLVAGFAYEHPLAKNWELRLSGFSTLIPFSLTGASAPMRLLGSDARLGRELNAGRWAFTVAVGFYYKTSFVNDDAYGFQNMYGPEAALELRYALPHGGTLAVNAKYAPSIESAAPSSGRGLSFVNTAAAGRLSYLTARKRWIYSLSLSELRLNQDGLSAGSKIVSLDIGLRL